MTKIKNLLSIFQKAYEVAATFSIKYGFDWLMFRFGIHDTLYLPTEEGGLIELKTHGDFYIYYDVYITKEYQLSEEIIDLINGHPVIDFGAEVGCSPMYFAEKLPNSIVYAYEPMPNSYMQLEVNSNGYENIVVSDRALADAGTKSLFLSNSDAHSSSFIFTDEKGTDEIEVKTISYSDAKKATGANKIGLFKVDIEGGEIVLLEDQGFIDDVKSGNINAVAIETHQDVRADMWEQFSKLFEAEYRVVEIKEDKALNITSALLVLKS